MLPRAGPEDSGDPQSERPQGSPRYDFDGIDLDSGSVHADVVKLVPEGSRVLELGPATGYMSRVLTERGCTVVGVELDPDMAEQAREFCERVIVGDLDVLDLKAELDQERFDAIVAADVIEHLKDPLSALTSLKPFLMPEGHLVISVPNIAHGSIRLALLSGRFEYREKGLLDSTHLRFFTRETLAKLLDDAELGVVDLHRHEVDFDVSEVEFDDEVVPAELRRELEQDEDARTYQFVVKAAAMEQEGMREIQARRRETAELQAKVEALEGAAAREAECRQALADAEGQLALRDTAIAQWEERHAADTGVLRGEIEDLRAERDRLQARRDRILASPPARLYRSLRRLRTRLGRPRGAGNG